MTADGAGVGERERLLSVLWESAAVNEEWRRWIIADALLAAGFGDVAQARAERDAALATVQRVREEALAWSGAPLNEISPCHGAGKLFLSIIEAAQ